jgi:hypothetical protein
MGYGDQFNFQTHQFADPTAGLQQALGAGGLFATTLGNMVSNDKDQIQLTRQSMEDQQRQQTFDNAQTEFQQRQDALAATAKDKAGSVAMQQWVATGVPTTFNYQNGADQNSPEIQKQISEQAAANGGMGNTVAGSNDYTFYKGDDGVQHLIRKSEVNPDGTVKNDGVIDYNSVERTKDGKIIGVDADGKNGKNVYVMGDDGQWRGASNNQLVVNQSSVMPNVITENSVRVADSNLDPSANQDKFIRRNDKWYQIDAKDPTNVDFASPVADGKVDNINALQTFGDAYNVDANDKAQATLNDLITKPIDTAAHNTKYTTPTSADIFNYLTKNYTDKGEAFPDWGSTALQTAKLSEVNRDKALKDESAKWQDALSQAQIAKQTFLESAENKGNELAIKEITANSGATPESQLSVTSIPNAKSENIYDKNVANNRNMIINKLGATADIAVLNTMTAQYDKLVRAGYDPDAVGSAILGQIHDSGKFIKKNGKDGELQNTFAPIDPAVYNIPMLTPEQIASAKGIYVQKKATKTDTSALFNKIIANSNQLTAQGARVYDERIAYIKQQMSDVNKSDLTTQNQDLKNQLDKVYTDKLSGYSDYMAKRDSDDLQKRMSLFAPANTNANTNIPTVNSSVTKLTQENLNNGEGNAHDPLHAYDDHFASTNKVRPAIGQGYSIASLNDELKRNGITTLIPADSAGANTYLDGLKTASPDQYKKILNIATNYQNGFIQNDINSAYKHTADLPDNPATRQLVAAYASYIHQHGAGNTSVLDQITARIKAHDFDGAKSLVNGFEKGKYINRKQDTLRAIDAIGGYQNTALNNPYQSQTATLQKNLSTKVADQSTAAHYFNDSVHWWDPITKNADFSRAVINNYDDKNRDVSLAETRLASSQQLDKENLIKQRLAKVDQNGIDAMMLRKELSDMRDDYWAH